MEQRGVVCEKPFPPGSKNRMVKIHSESIENVMHVLEVEYHHICDELGERENKNKIQTDGSLEVKVDCMLNTLKDARTRRRVRWDEFVDVIQELEGYSSSLAPVQFRPSAVLLSHKPNLSLKRLREMKYLLKLFKKDKNTSRHFKDIYLLCDFLNLDFAEEIFKSDKKDDGSTVFMLEDIVKRLEGLKKESLRNIAEDIALETKVMEELSKKKKVLSELVSQSQLNGKDYELDFNIEDIKRGRVDPTLMIKRLQGLILKLKEEVKVREEIVDEAEKILNTHNEEIQLAGFVGGIGTLLEKVETWETCHGVDFVYNEMNLKTELLKKMEEIHPSSSSPCQTCEEHQDISMSPSISFSSSASESSSDSKSKDSDYSPETSQSDDSMHDLVVPESDSDRA
ncbi:unnamed protein product [Alopecurus aequalis]